MAVATESGGALAMEENAGPSKAKICKIRQKKISCLLPQRRLLRSSSKALTDKGKNVVIIQAVGLKQSA